MTYYPYAYLCCGENSEGMRCSDIIFALSEEHAFEVSDDQGFGFDSVSRAPQYDEHWPLGYVPPLQLLEEGWWWNCPECDYEFSADEFRWDDERPEQPTPVSIKNWLYCSPDCAKEARKKAQLRRLQSAQVKAVLMSQLPNCTLTYVSPDFARFRFPGCRWAATWRSAQPDRYEINALDHDAWNRWQAEVKCRKKNSCRKTCGHGVGPSNFLGGL